MSKSTNTVHWVRDDEIDLTWCGQFSNLPFDTYDGGNCEKCINQVSVYEALGDHSFGSIRAFFDWERS